MVRADERGRAQGQPARPRDHPLVMIVVTNAYLLAQAAATPSLVNPRILWDSKLFDILPSAVSASSETASGPKDAPTRPNTDEYWEPAALPATIVFDLGQAWTIQAVGLGAHNFGSCGTAVKVEVGTDPAFATDATFAEE